MKYLLLTYLFNFFSHVNAQEISINKDYVDNQIIVKLKQGLNKNTKSSIMQELNAKIKHKFKTFDAELWEITNKQEDLKTIINNLQQNPNIEYAELNYITKISDIPNDEHFGKQWGLRNIQQFGGKYDADIDIDQAWNVTLGCSSVLVGIIDTGIDYNHEDLHNSVWTNPNEIPNNDIDDDNNGYVDDYYGYDFVNNDGNPMDDHYHGTHCAGVIAAEYNNEIGVSGIAPNARVVALKAFDSQGYSNVALEIEAIEYATLMNINLTNNSWGSSNYSQTLKNVIEENARPFIASAGNSSNNNDNIPYYPSGYDLPNVISVAATDKNDNLASFSNYGLSTVDIAAPGVYIYSCKLNNGYVFKDGTSMAAPHVSGVVALMLSMNLSLSPEYIRQTIIQNADYISNLQGKCVANGRLNAYKVLPYITGTSPVCTSNSTFTLNNLPPGVSVDWDCSDNLIIVSENNDSCTVHALNSYVSGQGTISASTNISGVCPFSLEKEIIVGKPKTIIESIETEFVENPEVPDTFPVNSASFKLEPNAYGYINFGAEFFLVQTLQWNLNYPQTNVCDVIQFGDHVTLIGRNNGSFFFTMQAENQCGIGSPAFVNVTVGYDGNPFPMLLSVSPNPTSDVLSVELSEEHETESTEKVKKQKIDVKLYNNMQIPVYANIKYEKKFDVNVSNLPTGVYHLQVIYKGEKISKQVLIQH